MHEIPKVNKIGYAGVAGIISLSLASESSPEQAILWFLGAFALVFALIYILEIVAEYKSEARKREEHHGLQ